MFDFLKKKETWKATFKTLGSAYSYAKIGDSILLTEPEGDYTEPQFNRKLDEAMYKFRVKKLYEPKVVSGSWQVELERD